jgi:tetratricopeptide (TPR) repeat protein
MSSLITKATKRGFSKSQKIRATKAKKAAARKPKRPGKITTAPRAAKKSAGAKKLSANKKNKHTVSSKKPVSRAVKKVAPKKRSVVSAAKTRKVLARKPAKKPAAKVGLAHKRRLTKAQARKEMLARRTALAPKPLPAPPKKPPSPGTLAAVRAFEQALRLFNRHDFGAAKSSFLSVLSKFPDQAEIVARARTYLAICDHRLARSPSVPRNADALYNQGVFELNKGNIDDAIELFEKALKVEPRADHVFYSLAAAYARLEDVSKAIEALRRAIGIRHVHRSHARRELDFVNLRSNEDFQQLTGFGFDLVDE